MTLIPSLLQFVPICHDAFFALQSVDTPSDYQVTVETMEKALLVIDCNKSPGPD